MENALLIGLSRQMTLRRELDVIANNVANVNTHGFRGDRLIFNDYLMPVARADAFPQADRRLHYVIDPRTATSFQAGTIEQSGGELDVALQGDGFFVVQTPRGERFTRAGNFQLNAQGELVTASGERVLTDSGPITFGAADGRVAIGADGTISTQQGVRGRLRVVRFADPAVLRKDGDTMFSVAGNAQPQPATGVRVLQGAVERSNVQAIQEISRMVEVTRAYQTVTQMIDRTQDLRRTAIERLGTVN